jgi:hypothetical protein
VFEGAGPGIVACLPGDGYPKELLRSGEFLHRDDFIPAGASPSARRQCCAASAWKQSIPLAIRVGGAASACSASRPAERPHRHGAADQCQHPLQIDKPWALEALWRQILCHRASSRSAFLSFLAANLAQAAAGDSHPKG